VSERSPSLPRKTSKESFKVKLIESNTEFNNNNIIDTPSQLWMQQLGSGVN